MNGIEKITARIEAEAQADAERIEAEALLQSEAVLAEGEAKAQEAYWRRIQDGVKAAEERSLRLGKAADMEARKSILSAKQEIVGEAFRRAEEKLCSMTDEPYIEFVAGQASRASVTGMEEIVLTAGDGEKYGDRIARRANAMLAEKGLPGKLTVSDTAGRFKGGMILRDGDVSVNCTIEALMAQAREELASAAAAELFS